MIPTQTPRRAMSMIVMLGVAGLAAAAAAAGTRTDWAAALRQDAEALHDDIASNHPGPVNKLDPGFGKRNDAALALALKRANLVQDYSGYLAAMRGYTAGFDDGHLSLSTIEEVPIYVSWPGFLTAYDARGAQIVRSRTGDAPVPIGAVLVACDGRSASTVGKEIVGDFRGRWSLAAIRGREGFRVFLDTVNPFVKRPQRCTFRVEGRLRTISLQWRPLPDDQWARYTAPVAKVSRPPTVARVLADGTRWYAMSDFDGDPSGEAAKALLPMIAAMKRDRNAVVSAPRIVLDLRGNGGGSSDWSLQVAAIVWGQRAIDALPGSGTFVEWRASAANVATLAAYREQFAAAADAPDALKDYFSKAATGIAEAHAAGHALWREPDDLYHSPPMPLGSTVSPPTAAIYVLTDWSCGSACLDAVDLWKALGAIQVGQETSADTLYMDVRQAALPGNRVRVNIPMKVYRGRHRGSNEPQLPRFTYSGDMSDTAGLETWIAGLPRCSQPYHCRRTE